ncbi:hypothetical protein GCM10007962_23890 [Yeosuana aromativorans]|uniref:SGNH/GDSL hydrolase family protein n=1 Tax=Yeosuana aromativorans TaxID=288019 RepID=A0A8J3BUA7_9FLAO|nr:hypothetical protein [Yeosuana aromativorans]GGK28875.1 hypothetical protein GCM10007962_23890 [Yeosuana aromativorans]
MKKLFLKFILYAFLILLVLESIIRIFHLTKDYPTRYVDQYGVEKWVPDQDGYSVTGIRRQNFSEYHINDFGYNSYREFKPTKDRFEIALVGDSFIEGFHQNYYNSIGKKIENQLDSIEVYEFGYAGYDFADELHLIAQYQSTFDLIDHVFIGMKFENDLTRGDYSILAERMKLESPLYRSLRQIKLLVYLQNIGAFDAARELTRKILSIGMHSEKISNQGKTDLERKRDLQESYLQNFEKLIQTYGFDKKRFTFLLNKEKTPDLFLRYLDDHGFEYLDFSKTLNQSKRPTTLIYDMHWNNHGRTLIARLIANYIKHKPI